MADAKQKQGPSPQGAVPSGEDDATSADAPAPERQGLSPQGTVPSGPGDATNVPGENAQGQPANSPADPLAAAEARAAEHLNDLQRLAAEFDNYRKRVARDQALLATRAAERLVKELLPVVDDLERALEAAEHHEEAKLEEGVRLVHRALADALRKQGLQEIEVEGRFDPHVHEALLSQPADADEGSVIEVVQKGYKLGDLVLRPARVVVSAGREETGG
jgi:molecular chaperone GrpE